MAKKDATLFAQKSSHHSMVRIDMIGHFDIMPESPTQNAGRRCPCPFVAR